MSEESLPLLLVSTRDCDTAAKFLSELIDNDVSDKYDSHGMNKVWRLQNKYYKVDVRVVVKRDTDSLEVDEQHLEAHIVHVTEKEEREAGEARALGGAPAHCVMLAALPAQRDEWAPQGYEPVPLQEGEGGEEEVLDRWSGGVQRLRDALHAHMWPGLRRLGHAGTAVVTSSDEEEEEEGAVERAELFAQTLGALAAAPDWRSLAGPEGPLEGEGERRERIERAEALLAAFCRALGEPLSQHDTST